MWGSGKPPQRPRQQFVRTERNLGPGPKVPAYVRQIPQGLPPLPNGPQYLGTGLWRENQNRLPSNTSVIGSQVPMVWRIVDISTPILGGASGPIIKYRWQRPLVLVQMKMLTTLGRLADLASLELHWEDGVGDQVPTSGMQPLTLCGAAISGRGQWMPLEQPVLHNDVHTFQITNTSSARESTITPVLLFQCVERDV